MAKLNERGHEILDPTPVSMPLGFKKPETLAEQIRRMVKNEMSQAAANQGQESFEEADDFDVGDDFDPKSPYEQNFDQDQTIEAENRGFIEESPIKQLLNGATPLRGGNSPVLGGEPEAQKKKTRKAEPKTEDSEE